MQNIFPSKKTLEFKGDYTEYEEAILFGAVGETLHQFSKAYVTGEDYVITSISVTALSSIVVMELVS